MSKISNSIEVNYLFEKFITHAGAVSIGMVEGHGAFAQIS